MVALWCACALALVAATLGDPQLRGVDPQLIPRYQATGSEFDCLDGLLTIPRGHVNDEYCDCFDGSDEPGAFRVASCCTAEQRRRKASQPRHCAQGRPRAQTAASTAATADTSRSGSMHQWLTTSCAVRVARWPSEHMRLRCKQS